MCGKPSLDPRKLDPELQNKVYRPNRDEIYNVEEDLSQPEGFGE